MTTGHFALAAIAKKSFPNFSGIWEQINNLDFKPLEFEWFKKQAGLNSFHLVTKEMGRGNHRDWGDLQSR
jgi:hypothetical protein